MNIWHDINEERIKVDDFIAVIEIPNGCSVKYELDKETGLLRVDRVLHTATHYPANYGFIPRTYADDRDPLDVLVLGTATAYPLSLMRCYPIGAIKMVDNNELDEKIIAIPFGDPNYNMYKSVDELPKHVFDEMKHFFTVYKTLENKDTVVDETGSREEAMDIIRHSIEQYRMNHYNLVNNIKITRENEINGEQ